MTNRAPLIVAIVLLILPVLYVGSYLALVLPDGERFELANSLQYLPTYRFGTASWAWRVYWPLERIDRRVRPEAWDSL
ncbi:hypothetical protein ETAA8_59690 [Anatilimnocola aggregata]|uniref:Uncharacterized protein n=1 Tax=Anatilimnocola aggregata TaxID=2528021 RepID=A0A517YKR9_9BACT|nr:hypothetical protein [Anatilimnocola aggregata]QDU30820.1 hypothetical protein ETAA8_59690 [Anatilimnocola aggregata]